MRFDSAGWAVGLAGCLADWLSTRNWRRISLGLLPILAAAGIGGLVAWGSMLNRDRLAERYLKLADAEVAQWENAWAPTPKADALAAEAMAQPTQAAATSPAAPTSPAATDAEPNASSEVPRFAEVLFRRVQQLHSDDQRSVFFVAMTLAQRGSLPQALSLLARIAPEDREGYTPAHVWLAEHYLSRPVSKSDLNTIKHHARVALRWSRTPASLLAAISQLFWRTGEPDVAVQSLSLAAERDPKFHLQLAGLASRGAKWKLLSEQSLGKAETHAEQQLEKNPQDIAARLQLISALLLKKDFSKAERFAVEGRQLEDDPRLRYAQSEIYRLQFASTLTLEGSSWTGNIELLNKAFHADPTNLQVFEEVAQIARLTGDSPSDQLMGELHKLLAAGKATAVTHLWIAEHYLVTKQMEKAVPHLEQALQRSPSAVSCLNNLAYCLATLYPERREEALTYIDRALAILGSHPAYHDTRGTVLVSLGRHKEAIASFERAVELLYQAGLPAKAGYHQRLAAAYQAIGQSELAQEHERVAMRLLQENSRARETEEAPLSPRSATSTESPSATEPATSTKSATATTAVEASDPSSTTTQQ